MKGSVAVVVSCFGLSFGEYLLACFNLFRRWILKFLSCSYHGGFVFPAFSHSNSAPTPRPEKLPPALSTPSFLITITSIEQGIPPPSCLNTPPVPFCTLPIIPIHLAHSLSFKCFLVPHPHSPRCFSAHSHHGACAPFYPLLSISSFTFLFVSRRPTTS